MTNPPEQRGRLRLLGTHREIAERNLLRCTRRLAAVERFGSSHGDPDIIRRNLDKWQDYYDRCAEDGTLDEAVYL